MIVMILAVFGMFWYYTGRATAMFEFFRTLEIIESHYAENVDRSALFDGALNGMSAPWGTSIRSTSAASCIRTFRPR